MNKEQKVFEEKFEKMNEATIDAPAELKTLIKSLTTSMQLLKRDAKTMDTNENYVGMLESMERDINNFLNKLHKSKVGSSR